MVGLQKEVLLLLSFLVNYVRSSAVHDCRQYVRYSAVWFGHVVLAAMIVCLFELFHGMFVAIFFDESAGAH